MKTLTIDRLDSISREDFDRNYFYPQKPVVIRGLASEQPAGSKWTLDYIRKVCGDVMVDIYDNKQDNSATAYTNPDLKMRFSDFMDIALAEEPTSLRMFL